MNSVGGVATERRHIPQFPPISSASPITTTTTTIINESEFPSLGAKGNSSLAGGFSPIPTTSGGILNAAQSAAVAAAAVAASSLKDGFPHRANYATLMRADPSLSNSEFQIQNEDFPALPGIAAGQTSRPMLGEQLSALMLDDGTDGLSMGNRENGPFGTRSGDHNRGIITHPDGEVSNIPPSMLADQFGMAGLVTYLRTVDNPSIVSLALGYDLTTLGLNLNLSERQLYTNFGGPWADSPLRPHEIDVKVPNEYMTNLNIRDKLPPVKLNKLSEDVLFYLFYNCPNEVYQLAAACELYQREWRYHKTDGVWLTRSQYGGIKEQTGTYEKGHYNVFDQLQWRKIPKELKLEYKELEERPKLPQMTSQVTPAMWAAMQPAASTSNNAATVSNLVTTLNSLGLASGMRGTGAGTPPPSSSSQQQSTNTTTSGINGLSGRGTPTPGASRSMPSPVMAPTQSTPSRATPN